MFHSGLFWPFVISSISFFFFFFAFNIVCNDILCNDIEINSLEPLSHTCCELVTCVK